MSDIQTLSASLTGDTAGFDAAMAAASAKSEAFEAGVHHAEESVKALGESAHAAGEHGEGAMHALNESIGEVAGAFTAASLAAGLIEKAVEVVKDLAVELVANAAAAQMVGVQFKAAFGSSAGEVAEWAEKTAAGLGRSADDMEKLATSARVMVGGLGVGSETANEMSTALAAMATQMSIARGIPLEEAMQKINAGMHGAGRGLYEFGIALNATTQSQEAMREGLGDTYSKLTQAQQAQVNFNIMMQGSAKLSADAAAATGTYTNQVASLKSHWEEATAHLGSNVLPAMTSLVELANRAVEGFDHLKGSTQGWIVSLAWGPVGVGIKMLANLRDEAAQLAKAAGISVGGGTDQDKAMRDQAAAQQAKNEEDKRHFDEMTAEEAERDEKRRAAFNDAASELKKSMEEQAKAQAAADAKHASEVKSAGDAAIAHATLIAKLEDGMRSAAEASAQSVATLKQKAADAEAKSAREAVADAEKAAQIKFDTATKNYGDAKATGGSGDIAAAKAQMDAAFAQLQAAAARVSAVDAAHTGELRQRLNEQIMAELVAADEAGAKRTAAEQAIANLKLATAADEAATGSKTAKAEADVRLSAAKSAAEVAVSAAEKAAKEQSKAQAAVQSAEDEIAKQKAQSDADHEAASKRAADYAARAQRDADEAHKKSVEAWVSMGKSAVSGIGGSSLGGVVGGAESGAAAGPAGAAAGAALALLTQSKQATAMADAVSGILANISDALGQFLGPLVPLIRQIGAAIKPLIDALGQVFGAAGRMLAATLTPLVPVISMVAKLLADILEPVAMLMDAIQPLIPIIVMINELMLMLSATAFVPLIIAIKALKPVLDLVAGVLMAITNAIADVWDSIIGAIQSVIRGIANILPDKLGGSALRDFADGMDSLKVHTDAATQAVSAFANGVIEATSNINAATQGPANTVNTATTYDQNDAVLREYFDLMVKLAEKQAADSARGTSSAANAAADKADQAYAAASAKYNTDAEKQRADAAFQAYVQAVNQFGISSQQAADAYAKYSQAQDAYNADQSAAANSNTAATAANTTATIALNTTMANVPQGFKVAAYEYAAASDGSTSHGGSTGARGGRHTPERDLSDSLEAALGSVAKEAPGVHIGGHLFQIATMQVVANNPEEFRKEIEIAAKRSNYLSAGLPVVSVAGHF